MVLKLLRFTAALIIFICSGLTNTYCQTGFATLNGTVTSPDGEKLELAAAGILGTDIGMQTNAEGKFSLQVPAGEELTLKVTFIGYSSFLKKVKLSENQTLDLKITLKKAESVLNTVVKEASRDKLVKNQPSIIKINPRQTRYLPTAFNEFNKVLATLPGVVSNNELSSTYSVRGGNFDENLIYVDNFEIYKPNLVSNGQQEGLSFVNPDMVADVEFSTGGWQPRLGDKLSSVLSIKYKRPVKFGGTASASLSGGSLQMEGTSRNKRLTFNTGIRHKNAVYILNSLPVQGNYKPKFTDYQGLISYDLSSDSTGKPAGKSVISALFSYASNNYKVTPSFGSASFGTISNPQRVNIYFDGHDNVNYRTAQGGLSFKRQFNSKLSSEFFASGVYSREREFRDLEAAYRFCQLNTNQSSSTFGECLLEQNVGSTYEHNRNNLLVKIGAFENRTIWTISENHEMQAGVRATYESIKDSLSQYSFQDSAEYAINLKQLNSHASLQSNRVSAYLQDTWDIDSTKTLTYGSRVSYWTLNKQVLFSPRVQFSFRSNIQSKVIYKLATGLYQQAPFYREMRDSAGVVNTNVRAQKSYHAIAGADYTFNAWGRELKLRSEAFFKYLTDVVPYDVDNVRIRYFGRNAATAYAAGVEGRVNGEFIRGAESWFSLGFLTTRENIKGDNHGYVRRPTDQRVTVGVFFQDHLPNNPSLKMYVNTVYGSGLATGIPGKPNLRGAVHYPAYYRVDIGFSKLITFHDEEAIKRQGIFQSVWLGVEILNIIAAENTISYTFVRDIYGRQFGVPNTLTNRLINAKVFVRF